MLKKRNLWVRIGFMLSIIGPGLITSIADNDVGGIATSSLVGAKFGYTLLWLIIPLMVCLFIVQEMGVRLAIVTQKGLSDLIREQFGLKVAFWAMISLFIANFIVTVTEFAGMAVAFDILNLPKIIFVPLFAVLLFFLLIKGSYKRVEKFLLLGASLYITYIVSGFLTKPDWVDVGKNLVVPHFSFDAGYVGILIAVIGTNITPWMQFYQQASIVDKGLKKEHYKVSLIDTAFGSIVTMLVSAFVIIAATGTLFKEQVPFTDLKNAALALVPVAGKYASLLFGVGLLATAVMAVLVIPLSTAYAITESFGWERGISKEFDEAPLFFIILGIFILLGAVTVLIPNFPFLSFIYVAQIINGMLLPITLTLMLILANNKNLMGSYTNTPLFNFMAWSFSIILVILSLYLVFEPIFNKFLG